MKTEYEKATNYLMSVGYAKENIIEIAIIITDFANSLNPLNVKVDDERPKGLTLHNYWDATTSEGRTETIERTFEYLDCLEQRLRSDKEEIKKLVDIITDKNNSIKSFIKDIDGRKVKNEQLKAKIDRDKETTQSNEIALLDEIKRLKDCKNNCN